jgi:dihydrofolate reductase
MRKLVLQEFVGLDGLAAGPDGSVDFVPASMTGDQQFGRDQLALMETVGAILLGRITYQMFADYWPNVTEGEDKVFAEKINATPKVVFSNTLERAPWGSWKDARIVRGSATEEVKKLRAQAGKNMVVWGSISLAQSLIDAELVDEFRLVVCPVVLGSGRPLFGEKVGALDLELLGAKAEDGGAVSLRYARNGSR